MFALAFIGVSSFFLVAALYYKMSHEIGVATEGWYNEVAHAKGYATVERGERMCGCFDTRSRDRTKTAHVDPSKLHPDFAGVAASADEDAV